jgi:hypothetical protein
MQLPAAAKSIGGIACQDVMSPNNGQVLAYAELDPVFPGTLVWRPVNPSPVLEPSSFIPPTASGQFSSVGITVIGWLQVNISGLGVVYLPYFTV